MTRARRSIVRPEITPYYHCINRCVRRAFLCGQDPVTGRNFEHRRQWMVDRLALLADVFAVDVCSYAIMSNHYHLTVRLAPDRVAGWSDIEVHDRWTRLYNAPPLVRRWRDEAELETHELDEVKRTLACWRERLGDLSWFMRGLNEYIARRANQEDDCTGRFWEGRFKSQALLDEPALLTGMVYVDLNPIRAGIAESLEASDYTSIQARIRDLLDAADTARSRATGAGERRNKRVPLVPLAEGAAHDDALPFTLRDYLELVDWSARVMHAGKSGTMRADAPPILHRLGIRAGPFAHHVHWGNARFHNLVGRAEAMRACARGSGRAFVKGTTRAELLFSAHGESAPRLRRRRGRDPG